MNGPAFPSGPDIGNHSLFLAEVFPDRIRFRAENRGFPSLRYYEALGQANFRVASDHRLADRYALAPIFAVLAERFQDARLALNDVSQRLFSLGDTDYSLEALLSEKTDDDTVSDIYMGMTQTPLSVAASTSEVNRGLAGGLAGFGFGPIRPLLPATLRSFRPPPGSPRNCGGEWSATGANGRRRCFQPDHRCRAVRHRRRRVTRSTTS